MVQVLPTTYNIGFPTYIFSFLLFGVNITVKHLTPNGNDLFALDPFRSQFTCPPFLLERISLSCNMQLDQVSHDASLRSA